MLNEKPLIGVIEDKEEFQKILKEELQSRYEVITAGTAKDGLEIVKNNLERIKFVISDLGLPKEKDDAAIPGVGIELVREIKKIAPFLQVVVITGTKRERGEEYAVMVMKMGVSDYISKSDVERLDKFIKDIIEAVDRLSLPDSSVSEDFTWLSENIPMLQEKYGGKWIAAVDKKVVAYGEDASLVYEEARREYPNKIPLLDLVPQENEGLLI